jgi:glutathione S-transferase
MKLFYSPASPFLRKVMAVAFESGIADQIEFLQSAVHPVDRDDTVRIENPLGQIPTLLTDENVALYDSPVICEYLDAIGSGRLFGTGEARWRALTEQALADGLLGASLLIRYETVDRPQQFRWPAWIQGQMAKIHDAMDRFEKVFASGEERVDIGTISIGCALGYLDFRFASYDWRATHPATADWFARFDERPSMRETRPRPPLALLWHFLVMSVFFAIPKRGFA